MAAQALGYESHEWATFKQWQERGARVRKAAKGTPIDFYKNLLVDAREEGLFEVRRRPRKMEVLNTDFGRLARWFSPGRGCWELPTPSSRNPLIPVN
ncbi:ArdC-like ssDNA-binding domain-containing protein [Methylocystis heyeri]|uniref:DUF1738 domain-containing protein n=1 Tax=Methylocystis heyeri TaxID=391905 RepID=A0A6B8KMD5_9HYPH|nr:ArdC family protein [Methylocystis heyeri]QGM48315.1 DUF1738 domain-containing protein [Methylocystis heyeri]